MATETEQRELVNADLAILERMAAPGFDAAVASMSPSMRAWKRERMREANQRRWDFCVLCHGPPGGSRWRVPLLHKFEVVAYLETETDEPTPCTELQADRVTVPVCERCKRIVLPYPHIQRSAEWRLVLLSWLIGWHWTIYEVRDMPARYLAKYADFLMRKVPDYIDTRALTT